MGYFLKKAIQLASYFWWWRMVLVVATVALMMIAVTVESGGAWYVLAAAIPAIVLFGVTGSRASTNHAAIRRIRREVVEAAQATVATTNTALQSSDKPKPTAPKPPFSRPEQPYVTVVVAAFNEHRHIVDCLRSIQRQTWADFECIVIDDASVDSTVELAHDEFSEDRRFEFVSLRSNVGLSEARNLGTQLARAPWITYVDGDDFLYEAALEKRVATLAHEEDNGWVAGAFCNWASVPENAILATSGKKVPARKLVTWLDALHDAPFIASAPILRTEIVRTVGGFRNVKAAEDADLWTKILRHGFVFLPTHYTGIAYRQKKRSMFRSETVEHAAVTTGLYVDNYQPMPAGAFAGGAPFPFTEPAPTYITAVESYRRNLVALTTAVAQENQAAVEYLSGLVATGGRDYLRWAVDAKATVLHAAKRSESYDPAGAEARAEILTERTLAIIGTDRPRSPLRLTAVARSLEDQSNADHGEIAGADWARLMDRKRIRLSPDATAESLSGAFVLMPSAAYHVKEFGPLGNALRDRGIPVAFMVNDRRWPWTEPGLRTWDFPVYAFPEDTGWTKSVSGIMALNDWGEEPHDAIVAANGFGVPTFAKVEGVQDFDDVDVHWTRNAYRTAAHILCQGNNDREALGPDVSTHIVGSSRLEKVWAGPPRRLGEDLAVVNLNFTYGVLEGARDIWVASVIEAGRIAGVPVVFSLHPAEKNHPEGAEVSTQPISYLLTKASVHISRFSTVPFEAMALGVPFVYHNPHHEKVPTFLNSRGAYEISHSADELAAAMLATRAYAADYRTKCESFFREQIDIDPERSSAVRAADVIERVLARN